MGVPEISLLIPFRNIITPLLVLVGKFVLDFLKIGGTYGGLTKRSPFSSEFSFSSDQYSNNLNFLSKISSPPLAQ